MLQQQRSSFLQEPAMCQKEILMSMTNEMCSKDRKVQCSEKYNLDTDTVRQQISCNVRPCICKAHSRHVNGFSFRVSVRVSNAFGYKQFWPFLFSGNYHFKTVSIPWFLWGFRPRFAIPTRFIKPQNHRKC